MGGKKIIPALPSGFIPEMDKCLSEKKMSIKCCKITSCFTKLQDICKKKVKKNGLKGCIFSESR